MNDVQNFISQLERQRSAIDRAISALREIAGTIKGSATTAAANASQPAGGKRRISTEGRKRMAEAARKWWADKEGVGSDSGTLPAACRKFQSGKRAAKKTPESRGPESNYRSYKEAVGGKARCGARPGRSGAKKVAPPCISAAMCSVGITGMVSRCSYGTPTTPCF